MKAARFALANLGNNVRKSLAVKTGQPLAKPLKIDISPSCRCNAKCVMCDRWRREEEALAGETLIGALEELREWMGPHFFVHITGGEPLLFSGLFDVAEYCAGQGIVCSISTNGIGLDDETCRKLAETRLPYVAVSIDSHIPEVHDRLRGTPGAFDKAIAGLARLRAQGACVLGVTSVVMRDNAPRLAEMSDFFLALGIDRLAFQPLHVPGGVPISKWKDSEQWVSDLEAFRRAVDEVIVRRRGDHRIITTPHELRSMVSYFENPLAFKPHGPCHLGHERLIIEHNGDLHLCYPGFPPIGNVYRDSIRQAWRSTEARRVRGEMLECRAPCMMAHNRHMSFAEKAHKFYFLMRKGLFT